jgi:hypothetical protein
MSIGQNRHLKRWWTPSAQCPDLTGHCVGWHVPKGVGQFDKNGMNTGQARMWSNDRGQTLRWVSGHIVWLIRIIDR